VREEPRAAELGRAPGVHHPERAGAALHQHHLPRRVAVPVYHEVAPPAQPLEEAATVRELGGVRQPEEAREPLAEVVLGEREQVVVQHEGDERPRRRGTDRGVDRGDVGRRELAMTGEEGPVVRRRRVEPHHVQPRPGLDRHARSRRHQLGGDVVAHPIVVPGHHHDPLAQRREQPLERGELRAAPAVRHVAGEQHHVDVRGDQRLADARRCLVRLPVAAEVEIRDVRDGPRHGAALHHARVSVPRRGDHVSVNVVAHEAVARS
jgi:hypothetical protein